MYKGSISPNVEFIIILGSKINSATPTKLNVLLKNLLQRKNNGIAVNTEIEIDKILWIKIFVKIFCLIVN